MVHPQTKLTRPIRLGIMILLIISFFIISPIIILYTAGYRYDFANHSLKQTGVISIDAEPNDAQVFLNQVQIKKKLPIRLTNRAPGTYTISIKKPGYKDWRKDITVESKQTAYIKNVTLFKEALPVPIFENSKDPLSAAYLSRDANYIMISVLQEYNIYEIILLDVNTQKLFPILRTKSDIEPEISWSPFNDVALIKTGEKKETHWQIFTASAPELTKTYTYPLNQIQSCQWSKNALSPTLYLREKERIKAININGERIISLATSTVWHVDSEENLWIFDDRENEIKQISKEQEILAQYHLKERVTKIIDANKNRIIMQTPENLLLLLIDGEGKIKETQTFSAQSVLFNEKTREWLVWSPWELWSIYEDGRFFLLNRTGEKIIFVAPMDYYGLLLLASENKITGFNPGYYVTQDLFSGRKIEQIGVNVKQRKIYFLGTVGQKRGLFELEY